MIGYYVIVATLLIYLHSTNADSTFTNDIKTIENHLLQDRPFLRRLSKKLDRGLSFGKRTDIVCDLLDENEKQSICDELMVHLINATYPDRFMSFVNMNMPFLEPQIVDPNDRYTCKEIPITKLNMEKRMYWCKNRQYKLKPQVSQNIPVPIYLPSIEEEYGFFSAGSRKTKGRIFALRPSEMSSESVSPVGEMDNVDIIFQKAIEMSSKEDSSSSASESSTHKRTPLHEQTESSGIMGRVWQ